MTTHPRHLELERLAMGEPSAAKAHVDACPDCSATVSGLKDAARSFVARHPTVGFIEELDRRRAPRWKTWWPLLGLVPVAAALVVFFLVRPGPEVRLKGGGLQVIVKRGQTMQDLGVDERPQAGDVLSFVFDAPRAGHLLLVDVERGRAPTAFVPFQGKGSMEVQSGRTWLSNGVVLDGTTADEWLLVVFSPRALSTAEVVSTLGEGPPSFACDGCQVEVRTLTRVRP